LIRPHSSNKFLGFTFNFSVPERGGLVKGFVSNEFSRIIIFIQIDLLYNNDEDNEDDEAQRLDDEAQRLIDDNRDQAWSGKLQIKYQIYPPRYGDSDRNNHSESDVDSHDVSYDSKFIRNLRAGVGADGGRLYIDI